MSGYTKKTSKTMSRCYMRYVLPFFILQIGILMVANISIMKHVSTMRTMLENDNNEKLKFVNLIPSNNNLVSQSIPSNNIVSQPQRVIESVESESRGNNDSNRYFVIHTGPLKTATTTIQCGLQSHDVLPPDSRYSYVGKTAVICGTETPIFREKRELKHYKIGMWEDFANGITKASFVRFKNRLRSLRDDGQNIVMSSEEFCLLTDINEDRWDLLTQTFHGLLPDYEQRIIVTYRRYYEWVVSEYYWYYGQKDYLNPSYGMLYPNKSNNCIASRKEKCIPTIYEYMNMHYDCTPYNMYQLVKKHFANVQVFDMHGGKNEDDLLTRFICELPDADKECENAMDRLNNNTNTVLKANNSPTLNHAMIHSDRIIVGAYRAGIIKRRHLKRYNGRLSVIKWMKQKNLSFASLPKICMNDEQANDLLSKSIQYEKEMLGDRHDEALLRKEFVKYRQKKKLCSVDVDKILQMDEWKQFLGSARDGLLPKLYFDSKDDGLLP